MSAVVQKPTLFQQIQSDIHGGRTFDTPVLRYNDGPIRVFLWDHIQTFPEMKAALDLSSRQCIDGYRGAYFGACTEQEFLPWYEIGGSSDFPTVCLEDPFDLEYCDVPEYFVDDPKPIKGRVADVSLEVLQLLDEFYDQGYSFERQLIDVRVRALDPNSEVIKCWTWMNTIDDLFEFSPHTAEYKVKPQLDFTPFASDEKFYFYGDKGGTA